MDTWATESDELGDNDVRTTINHLLPESTVVRRYVCDGNALSTGQYSPYDVVIRDVRPMKEEYTLETKGFELATCPTKVNLSHLGHHKRARLTIEQL